MPRIALALLAAGSLFASGCAMCQDCFDYAYPHYGSVAPRTDRFCGRVGSAFAPGGPDVGEVSPYKRETDKGDLYTEGPPSNPQRNPAPRPPSLLETAVPADGVTR